jgi:hypothetical protein
MAKDELSAFWDVTKSLTAFLAIFLFFIGWVYLAYYFKNFGIDVSSLQLQVWDYYIYGFYAAQTLSFAVFLLITIALLTFLYYIRERIRYFYMAIITAALIIFPLSWYFAKSAAEDRVMSMLRGRDQTFPIAFTFKRSFLQAAYTPDTLNIKPYKDRIAEDMEGLNLFLSYMSDLQVKQFYENEKNFYVYVRHGKLPEELANIHVTVFTLPKEYVEKSYIFVDQSSKN